MSGRDTSHWLKLDIPDWDIRIDPATGHGYFEWVGGTNADEECAGALWFEGMELTDYDGVFDVPKPVKVALAAADYNLDFLEDA